MVYTSLFFSSKCSMFHNSNVFGSCIIHILYTGCAKIKKNNSGAKRLKIFSEATLSNWARTVSYQRSIHTLQDMSKVTFAATVHMLPAYSAKVVDNARTYTASLDPHRNKSISMRWGEYDDQMMAAIWFPSSLEAFNPGSPKLYVKTWGVSLPCQIASY